MCVRRLSVAPWDGWVQRHCLIEQLLGWGWFTHRFYEWTENSLARSSGGSAPLHQVMDVLRAAQCLMSAELRAKHTQRNLKWDWALCPESVEHENQLFVWCVAGRTELGPTAASTASLNNKSCSQIPDNSREESFKLCRLFGSLSRSVLLLPFVSKYELLLSRVVR